ncbi:unnamed protein product, partial [Didymodactylos carnosus]
MSDAITRTTVEHLDKPEYSSLITVNLLGRLRSTTEQVRNVQAVMEEE